MAGKCEKKHAVKKPHLIVCEGLDAKLFMDCFLVKSSIADNPLELFQPIDAGGNSDIPVFIKTLPDLPNFTIVKSVTIIRDSEKEPQGANQSVRKTLEKGGFAVPNAPCAVAFPTESVHNVKAAYALFPKLNSCEAGTLEDLCLKILAHSSQKTVLSIADDALAAYKDRVGELKRPHKNRLHTYLSLTDDFVGSKIGESSRKNAFNFLANELEPLKNLLCTLLKD